MLALVFGVNGDDNKCGWSGFLPLHLKSWKDKNGVIPVLDDVDDIDNHVDDDNAWIISFHDI
jgi:hypothetical protein